MGPDGLVSTTGGSYSYKVGKGTNNALRHPVKTYERYANDRSSSFNVLSPKGRNKLGKVRNAFNIVDRVINPAALAGYGLREATMRREINKLSDKSLKKYMTTLANTPYAHAQVTRPDPKAISFIRDFTGLNDLSYVTPQTRRIATKKFEQTKG